MKRRLPLAIALLVAAGCVPDPGKAAGLPGPLPSASVVAPDPVTPSEPAPLPTTRTSALPTATPTPGPAASPTPTAVPSAAPSASPSASASPTPSATPTPKPPTIHTLTIAAHASQTLTLPTSATLELEGRIDAPNVTGISACMLVYVNSQIIRQAVTNRSMQPIFGNGVQRNLFDTDTNAWSLMLSPDFTTANSAVAGDFQVTTDPGQAYRYVWDVAAQKGTGATMTVRLDNLGQEAQQQPVIVKVYQR